MTPFEDEGEEKIAIYAGGNSLAATPHGENFWVFSLNGTMGPEEGTEKEAEGTTHAGEESAEEEEGGETGNAEENEAGEEAKAAKKPKVAKKRRPAGAPDAEAGKEVFSENCSVCHGADRPRRQRRSRPDDDAESQRTGRRRKTGDQRRRRDARLLVAR